MRSSTIARVVTLAAACLTASAALSSVASAADLALVTKAPGSSVKAVGATYDVGTSYRVNCPASTGPDGCSAAVTMLALVNTPASKPHVALVGRGRAVVAAGSSKRVAIRLTFAGAQEVRLRGRVSGQLHLTVTEHAATGAMVPDRVSTLARPQLVAAPAVIVGDATRLTRLTLLPGQRLVLRLRGENASTGYAWKVSSLTSGAPLRRVSTRSIVDADCGAGTVGCFSTREIVYVGRFRGTVALSAGLYGPQPETDATVRFDLRVTSTGPAPALPLLVTAKASGTKVYTSGDQVTVRLRGASGSTGYHWVAQDCCTPDLLTPVAHVVIADDCFSGMAGCAQTDEFTYNVRFVGNATIALGLFGPAPGTGPADSFEVTVSTPIP